MKKSLDSIDAAKFLGSILIFTMHCGALNDYEALSILPQLLARWGVPFFFICSAYFLFGKSTDGNIGRETLLLYAARIGTLYGVWLVYNVPNVIFNNLYAKDLTSIQAWLEVLKYFLLSQTFTGSWYLASSVFSAWLVWALCRRLRTKTVMGITLAFYLLCVLTSSYKGLLTPGVFKVLVFLCFPLNLFNGCFYFAAGKYISENRQTVLEILNRRRALIWFLVFYALFIAEIFATRYFEISVGTDASLFTIPMSICCFLFCLQANVTIKNARLLRKLSTIIYCCQGNVLLINGFLMKMLHVPSLLCYLISSLAVSVVCAAVLYLQKHTQWKWPLYLT